MAQRRLHFIDVRPPQVIWLAAGSSPKGAVRQAEAGAAVRAGAVVAGVEHTSTVAVTPLPGTVGEVATICDSRARQRQAVAVHVAPGAGQGAQPQSPPFDLDEVTPDDLPAWIDRLERAGVRADRHNSPDLIGQLIAAVDRPIDSILCHALEADPTLPVQVQWALRHPLELRDGLRLLAKLTGARRTVLAAAEGDNRRLFRHLRRSARGELAEREAAKRGALGQAATGRADGALADAARDESAREAETGAEEEPEIRDIRESQSVIVPFDPAGKVEIASGAAPDVEPEPEPADNAEAQTTADAAGAQEPAPGDSRRGGPALPGAQRDIAPGDAAPRGLAYERLARRPAPDTALGLRLTPVLNAYPQADPTLLVWALLSRRLAPGKLPTEAGAIVLDAVAAIAIGAVARGTAVIARQPLAVRDHRNQVSLLADIWRGSRASDVLHELGLIRDGDERDATSGASGPPLSPGEGVTSEDAKATERVTGEGGADIRSSADSPSPGCSASLHSHPLPAGEGADGGAVSALRGGDFLRERMLPLDCVLDGGEILLHLTAGDAPPPAEPCIRCGWCLDICPTHVHPAGVLEAAQRQDELMAQRFGVAACIECGLCSYICPSRLPLMPAAQMMKR